MMSPFVTEYNALVCQLVDCAILDIAICGGVVWHYAASTKGGGSGPSRINGAKGTEW